MNTQYIDIINNYYQEKKKNNPAYSLRAFAGNLGIHPSTLSHIMKGRRKFPVQSAERVAKKLGLENEEYRNFLKSIYSSSFSKVLIPIMKNRIVLNDVEYCDFLTQWCYPLVMTLIDIDSSERTFEWLEEKVPFSQRKLYETLKRLEDMGMVFVENEKFYTCKEYTATDEKFSLIIQQSHRNNLELASSKISSTPIESRSYRFLTLPANKKKMNEFNDLVTNFFRSAEELLGHDSQDVYRLAIQLFPISKQN